MIKLPTQPPHLATLQTRNRHDCSNPQNQICYTVHMQKKEDMIFILKFIICFLDAQKVLIKSIALRIVQQTTFHFKLPLEIDKANQTI